MGLGEGCSIVNLFIIIIFDLFLSKCFKITYHRIKLQMTTSYVFGHAKLYTKIKL